MIRILSNVRTDELTPGDVVVHSDGDILVFVKMDTSDLADHGYAYLWWAYQPGQDAQVSTTAQPHNMWNGVIRPTD